MTNQCIIFPGQGSQYVGMGLSLFKKYQFVKDIYKQASVSLNFNVAEVCFESNDKKLEKTNYIQPCLLTVEYSYYKVLEKNYNIQPKYLAGHSFGELTALVCSGAISFLDGLKISAFRGRIMEECANTSSGIMVAINNIDIKKLEEICARYSSTDKYVCISNYNSAIQSVISGDRDVVNVICKNIENEKASTYLLNVGGAFHSNYMHSAYKKLSEYLKDFRFNTMTIPVISNVTALPYADENSIKTIFPIQLIKPVDWISTCTFLERHGINFFIEVCPKANITNITNENLNIAYCISFKDDKLDDDTLITLRI